MATADKFFKEAPKKAAKTQKEKKTYSKNELEGVEIIRTADGKIDKKATYYNVSLRFPKKLEAPIKDIAWENRKSVTEYITDLIEADLKKHKKL